MTDRLGGQVARELERLGPGGAIAEVVAAWPAAVGEAIARQAWPARLARDGTLHVATSSSAWAFELGQLAETLRARLAERLESAPPRLRFAPGPLPERGSAADAEPARPGVAPSETDREQAAALVSGIDDEELRALVARAAAASLARAAADRRSWYT